MFVHSITLLSLISNQDSVWAWALGFLFRYSVLFTHFLSNSSGGWVLRWNNCWFSRRLLLLLLLLFAVIAGRISSHSIVFRFPWLTHSMACKRTTFSYVRTGMPISIEHLLGWKYTRGTLSGILNNSLLFAVTLRGLQGLRTHFWSGFDALPVLEGIPTICFQ